MEDVKNYLRQYVQFLNRELDALDDIVEFRLSHMGPKAIAYSDMPKGGGGGDSLAAFVSKLDEKQDKYISLQIRRRNMKCQIEESLNNGGFSAEERVIIRLRYLIPVPCVKNNKITHYRHYGWSEIDEIMQISQSKSMKLHRKALKKLKK